MNELQHARELAALLLRDPRSAEPPKLLQGVIASVAYDRTATVYISGGAEFPVGNIRVFDHYQPTAGDVVWLVKNGPDLMVLGKLRPKLAAVEAWKLVGAVGQPAFQNSWVNFGSGFADAAFYKDPDGWVHLRGLVKNGTNQATIFTLPVGYRPANIFDSHQLAQNAAGQLQITTDGQVRLYNFSNNQYAGLDGISFPTDPAMNHDGWETVPGLAVANSTWYQRTDADLAKFFIREDGLVQMTGVYRADSAPDANLVLTIPERARIAGLRYLLSACGHNNVNYQNSRADITTYGYVRSEYNLGATVVPVFTMGGLHWWNAEAEPGWIAATLQNSWVNYGGLYAPASYRKDKYGRVHVRGLIANGTITNGTVLMTLPVGYRPAAKLLFPAETGGAGQQARVDVLADGTVICQLAAAGYFSLSNICFRAEA